MWLIFVKEILQLNWWIWTIARVRDVICRSMRCLCHTSTHSSNEMDYRYWITRNSETVVEVIYEYRFDHFEFINSMKIPMSHSSTIYTDHSYVLSCSMWRTPNCDTKKIYILLIIILLIHEISPITTFRLNVFCDVICLARVGILSVRYVYIVTVPITLDVIRVTRQRRYHQMNSKVILWWFYLWILSSGHVRTFIECDTCCCGRS